MVLIFIATTIDDCQYCRNSGFKVHLTLNLCKVIVEHLIRVVQEKYADALHGEKNKKILKPISEAL